MNAVLFFARNKPLYSITIYCDKYHLSALSIVGFVLYSVENF